MHFLSLTQYQNSNLTIFWFADQAKYLGDEIIITLLSAAKYFACNVMILRRCQLFARFLNQKGVVCQ